MISLTWVLGAVSESGGAGGVQGPCGLSIACGKIPARSKSFEAENVKCCSAAQAKTPTPPKLPVMSLEERLTKIRDSPKLQGQQHVCRHFSFLRRCSLTIPDACAALGH